MMTTHIPNNGSVIHIFGLKTKKKHNNNKLERIRLFDQLRK